WYYPKVVVSEFVAGYQNYTGWGTGWAISCIAGEAGIANIVTPTIRTYLTSGGYLGIGTTSPVQKLHVASGDIDVDSGYGFRINNGASTGQYLRGDGTRFVSSAIQGSDLPGSFSGFADPTATIGLSAVNGSATTAMRSDAAPALSQAIIPTWTGTHTFSNATYSALFTGGNVGIGITTPATKLDLDSNSNTTALRIRGTAETTEIADIYVASGGQLVLSTANTIDTSPYIEMDAEDDQWGFILRDSNTGSTQYTNMYMNDAATDYLNIVVNDTNATAGLVLQAGGNVGIGTATPGARLDVTGSGGTWTTSGWNKAIEIPNASVLKWETNAGSWRHAIGQTSTGLYFARAQGDDGTPTAYYNMFLGDSGSVGIGTTGPNSKLEVQGDSGGVLSLLRLTNVNGAAAGTARMTFQYFSSGNDRTAYIESVPDFLSGQWSPGLAFGTGYQAGLAERMRILSDGKVGIGTTSPSYTLDVNGTARATRLQAYQSGGGNADLIHLSNGSATWYMNVQGGIGSSFWLTGSSVSYGYSIYPSSGGLHGMGLYPSSANARLHVHSPTSGPTNVFEASTGADEVSVTPLMVVQKSGNVGIGDSSPTYRLQVDSGASTTAIYGQYDANRYGYLGSSSYGGYFYHSTSGGFGNGVRSEAHYTGIADPSYTYGAYINSTSTSQDHYGVYNYATNGAGYSSGFLYGIYNYASNSNTSQSCYGIYTEAASNGNTTYGIWATAYGGTTNWAGYFSGNVCVAGSTVLSANSGGYNVTIGQQDNTNEGGEILMDVANNAVDWYFDAYSDDLRFHRNGDVEFMFQNDGTGRCDGSWLGGGADVAEYMPAGSKNLEPGDLLALDSHGKVVRAVPGLVAVGMVSTRPGLVAGGGDAEKSHEGDALIALAGRVPVKVCSLGGPIQIGDPISVSAMPGLGAKASSARYILGRSLQAFDTSRAVEVSSLDEIKWPEDVDGDNKAQPCFKLPDGTFVGKVMIFVDRGYHDATGAGIEERLRRLEEENSTLKRQLAEIVESLSRK
ncbi:MAG: hypothetical protein RDV41_00570, partial [Planctomycetota bacterium]|nr:hypothetical protein [Planctomycetota bacterium]